MADEMNRYGYHGNGTGRVEGQTVYSAGTRSNDKYRYGLQTQFQGQFDPASRSSFADYANDSDPDVRRAQRLTSEMSAARAGLDAGVDWSKDQAELDAVMGRIGLKNSLGSAIANNSNLEGQAEEGIQRAAGHALDAGVRNTDKNYNRRGLLYSGMRESGDESVKSAVAGQMASDLSKTKREYGSLADEQKRAYASIGLQEQQRNLELANQAFETVSRNNIARAQAYQEMAGGVGQAAGYIYGSYNSGGQKTPNSSLDFSSPAHDYFAGENPYGSR